MRAQPGSIVRYREREWVVLPSGSPELVLLRPIGGSIRETCSVLLSLAQQAGYTLSHERIEPAGFPLPVAEDVQDHAAVRLVLEAARLLLREGASPFRSLGRISFRPRPYQFVPLLMALRLPVVRLLIADDVGIGKTIEAGLIARELLDRGEVNRLAVLCPPYLCDQWQRELRQKFQVDAVVVRSGTISQLERDPTRPPDTSIFRHNRFLVASIDLVKAERYRAAFLQHCPELVIVDEAHGAARPPSGRHGRAQQQRHELVRQLAADERRHLILLTATPHSGIEESFLSLLGLLKPDFGLVPLAQLDEAGRRALARHFVQRRRADVARWLGEETPFPEREDIERPYYFTDAYRKLYREVYGFAREVVRSAETLTGWRKRMRTWSALALLRCVTSSPAAAESALLRRIEVGNGGEGRMMLEEATEEELAEAFEPLVYDPMDVEAAVDTQPSSVFEAQEQDPSWDTAGRRRLRQFAHQARELRGDKDPKLLAAVQVVAELLEAGFHPIVWCRFIATADYVAEELQERLASRFAGLRVDSITGKLSEEERQVRVQELAQGQRRVLVATDCLSEGINLQEHFNAVVHYDLPWNPNRLEQREGRVDRFGQRSPVVKAVLIYGRDNPVDRAVLSVLLRKAEEIRRDLGVHVPVPVDSEGVMEAVFSALFARASYGEQLSLFELPPDVEQKVRQMQEAWAGAAAREKESRTRFAQHAIRPDEVAQQLEKADAVLGSPEAVRQFLLHASQRLGFSLRQLGGDRWEVGISALPESVRLRLGGVHAPWLITFSSPAPPECEYVGRNHPFVEALAEHILHLALYPGPGGGPVSRCGAVRTAQVARRTSLLLLRLRYLQREGREAVPVLAEETLVWGFRGRPPGVEPLPPEEARQLMDSVQPVGNIPLAEKRETIAEVLSWWPQLQALLGEVAEERAQALAAAHRQLRQGAGLQRVSLEPQLPPDLLGLVVLLPVPGGVTR
jgi:superfamily II DNA or RNA helicase